MTGARILVGDARARLAELETGSVQTCVTSPPYFGLRDYGTDEQIGLEDTPAAYVKELVTLFDEVWRVLKEDGTLWLNIGDSYAGSGKGRNGDGTVNVDPNSKQATSRGTTEGIVRSMKNRSHDGLKPKDLIGIPWRVAFALQADGWYLRQDIIWAKPNPMPESVTDRCTKSHEYLFLLSKSARYYFDNEAIKEDATGPAQTRDRSAEGYAVALGDGRDRWSPGERTYGENGIRNKRDVWTIPTKPFKGAHFAVMPEALVEPCILAGSREGDTVLDPFAGSGTVGVVALRHQRNFVGVELNPEYAVMAENRIKDDAPLLNAVEMSYFLKNTGAK
jgi:DNA modification methylase